MTVAEALDIAATHHRAGRLAEAEAIYRQVLAEFPDMPEALHLFGVLQHQCGHDAEAIASIRRAVAAQPQVAAYRVNLAAALHASGDATSAIAACRHALALEPNLPEAHYNLGLWLFAQQEHAAALDAIREAIRLRADYAEAHCAAGNVLAAQERVDEAIAAYGEAVRHRADYAEAHYNLANMLVKRDDTAAAVRAYRTALELRPDYTDAHFNLGNLLHRHGELDAAVVCYEAALRAQPQHTGALWNLGNVWKDGGRLDSALAVWRRALAIEPGDAALHSTLVLYLRFDPASSAAQIAAEEARWNAQHAGPLRPRRLRHERGRDSEKRLRVGYVSPDFWNHAVGRNVLPLFATHDRAQFEVFCYACSERSDALTARLRAHADHWCDATRLSDDELAARIHADEVDVLVDLALHTGGNRLLTFARQPAPVQFSFAGYPGGAGVETIAHRISDPHLEGSAAREPGTHLIDSFWCFDPVDLDLPVNPLPAATGAPFTFACLNHAAKINAAALALWARVLRACADSRLMLLSPRGSHRALTLDTLHRHGVAPERVDFAEPGEREEYMRLYHRADAMLDSFPYNGHTTSLEALWMGVPVVTLPGGTIVSRAGLSQLHNLEMPGLIARDADDFVRIATDLSRDLPGLAELRRTLRPRMERSVLMDAVRFTRGIEAAYRTAWRVWCGERKDETMPAPR